MGGSKKQTVGYKYYAGVHMVLCHGPIDKIVRIEVDDRVAWQGSAEAAASPVRVNVDKPKLFGGESREGGISGALDVLFGLSGQPRSDYLLDKIGSPLVSAYRGVTSLVLRQMYLGNNPYLKPWAFTAQRIHLREDGAAQWYDAKAEVLNLTTSTTGVTEGFVAGTAVYAGATNAYMDPEDALHPDYAANYGQTYAVGNAVVTETEGALDSGPYSAPPVAGSVDLGSHRDRMFHLFCHNNSKDNTGGYTSAVFEFKDAGGDTLLRIEVGSVAFDMVYLRYGLPGSMTEAPVVNTGAKSGALVEGDLLLGESSITFSRRGDFGTFDRIDSWTYPAPGNLVRSVACTLGESHASYLNPGGASDPWVGVWLRLDSVVTEQYTTGDMNPAHIIRECLTDGVWGRGLPETEIGPSYAAAADTLFDEGLGLSMMWTDEAPIEDFIGEVMRHIDAVRFEDPETGLQEIKLIRGDYNVDTLPVLDPSNSEVTQFDNTAISELVNQVTVKYWNRSSDSDAAITVQDTAAITLVGGIVNATYDYPGITRDDVAMQVAQRDLAATSQPFARGKVTVNRQVANLKPGDVFVLNDPALGVAAMVCRVAKRTDSGLLNGELTLEFGEDVFGRDYNLYAAPPSSGWVDPVGPPQDFSHVTALELPYPLIVATVGDSYVDQVPTDAGYYGLAATRPGEGAHLNYDLYVYPDGTGPVDDPELATKAEFTPFAVTAATVDDPLETAIPITDLVDADGTRAGDLVLIGEGSDAVREIAALSAAPAEGDVSLSLIRGVADTLPRPIPAGTVLYVIGADLGTDEGEYLAGETIEGYGTPVNGQGVYEGPYDYRDVPLVGRFFKPYPPGNVTIDGAHYPTAQAGDFTLTWADRNRVTQSDQVVGFTEAGVAPEANTSYTATLYGEDDAQITQAAGLTGNTWTYTEAAELSLGLTELPYSGVFDYSGTLPVPGPRLNSTLRVTLGTQRDAEDSLQTFDHTVVRNGYGYRYGENYGGS